MIRFAKYGLQTAFLFPMLKRGSADFAISTDWTPASGDCKISSNGGNVANTTNLPVAVGGAGSALWSLTLTAAELQCAGCYIQIVDSATKAVEDQSLEIYTTGDANAKIKLDLTDLVRAGLTALPNAAAEAAGGLYTRGTGAGQLNQGANGQIDANVVTNAGAAIVATGGRQEVNVSHFLGVAATAAGGIPSVNMVQLRGVQPNALVSGRFDASVGAMAAGVLAAAAFSADAIDANAFAASAAAEIVAAVQAMVIETNGSVTFGQCLSLMLSALCGVTANGGSTFKDPSGTSTRIAATIDGNNNRTAMVCTPSA